jgi:hypothetical protein
MALAARAVVVLDRATWPIRDRLLCAITWDLPADAERAAREVIARRYSFGRFSPEDAASLRLWAQTEAARSVLARWRESGHVSIGTVSDSGVSRCDSRVLAIDPSEIIRVTPPNETVPIGFPLAYAYVLMPPSSPIGSDSKYRPVVGSYVRNRMPYHSAAPPYCA